jgi:hypothetical protein
LIWKVAEVVGEMVSVTDEVPPLDELLVTLVPLVALVDVVVTTDV